MCGLTEAAEMTSKTTFKSKGVHLGPFSTVLFFTLRKSSPSAHQGMDIVRVKMNGPAVLRRMKPHVNHPRRGKEVPATPRAAAGELPAFLSPSETRAFLQEEDTELGSGSQQPGYPGPYHQLSFVAQRMV